MRCRISFDLCGIQNDFIRVDIQPAWILPLLDFVRSCHPDLGSVGFSHLQSVNL